MKFSFIHNRIMDEISSILKQIDDEAVESLVDTLIQSERIFVTGLGRSGLVARSFAMRLMHLGFKVMIVGDTTTPAINKNDLLIAISGSGETAIIHHIVTKSKEYGAKVCLITSKVNASISKMSDQVLVLPNAEKPALPLKSAFEAAVYILLDSAVIMLMNQKGITPQEMMNRHSNLE